MKLRNAKNSELNDIFMMGFDAWSNGISTENYLKSCHESIKYKKGQFKVLDDSNQLLSSLICYQLSENWYGIGSIATPIGIRNQGWGSKITLEAVKQLENENGAQAIFLFADISSKFYERLGFVELPDTFQDYKTSTCMLRTSKPEMIWHDSSFKAPDYF